MATDSRAYSSLHVSIVDFIKAGRNKQSRKFDGSRRWSLRTGWQGNEYVELTLHGNAIARHSHHTGWEINLCGWVTPTTMRTLSYCTPARIATKGGIPNIRGWVVPSSGWFSIYADGSLVVDPVTNRPTNFEPHIRRVSDNAAVRYINKHLLTEVHTMRKAMAHMHNRNEKLVQPWMLRDFIRHIVVDGGDITSAQPDRLESVLNATGAQINEAIRVATNAYIEMRFENMNSHVAYETVRVCKIKEAIV